MDKYKDTVMEDRDPAKYPDPSGPGDPSPYPTMYHGESPNVIPSQNSILTGPLTVSPITPLDRNTASAGNEPWTADFFKRLTTIGNQRFGTTLQPLQPLVTGDGIRIQNANDQSPPLPVEQDDQQSSSRGRGRGRGRPRGRGRGGGDRATSSGRGRRGGRPRGWRALIQGTEHADLFAKPKAPRRGSTGKKRGRKPAHMQPNVNASGEQWKDPGPEFKALQGNATRAFLDGDLDTALDYAKLALEKNPEVYMAHKMIHDIYQQQGKERDAIYALAVGVNLKRSAETYADLGERIMALGTRELEWARECFTEALKLDHDHYRARTGKLQLHLELEEWHLARMDAGMLVAKWPAELEIVNKYVELCMRSGLYYEWQSARAAYERAIAAYAGEDMLGDDYDQQWTHVNDYSDILLKLGLFPGGVFELKRLARWILGRKKDVFWDEVADDREFDIDNDRRLDVENFRRPGVSTDPARYGHGLPLELRVKLGLFRLRMHMRDEALRHFEHLQRQDVEVEGLEDLLMDVADHFKMEGMFREALRFYERLAPSQDVSRTNFWLALAQCHIALDRKEDAENCWLQVKSADKYDLESRIQLARLYNSTGQSEKALKAVDEVMNVPPRPLPLPPTKPIAPKPSNENEASQSATTPDGTPLPATTVVTPSPAAPIGPTSNSTPITLPPIYRKRVDIARGQNGRFEAWTTPQTQKSAGTPLRAAEKFETVRARVHEHYAAVKALWPSLRTGSAESNVEKWIEHAEAMASEFKRAQNLTTYEAQVKSRPPSALPQALIQEMETFKKKALNRLNIPLPAPAGQVLWMGKIFDISAQEWHWILSDLALLLAERVEQEKCYDILQTCLIKPVLFRQNPELSNTTQAVCLCCALLFNDSKMLTDVAHHYILRGERRSATSFQLLAATGRLSHGEAYFYDRKTTKWLHETVVAGSDGPPDPNLLTLCGHNSAGSTHAKAHSALPFLLRALALQPDNIVVNLSIATTYLSNAARKESADRKHDIAQGLAFFHRYYDLRVASGKVVHIQEAEFNRARLWQQLGLPHRATDGYMRVLEMSEEVKRELVDMASGGVGEKEDFTLEAAFALQSIFLEAGNERAARSVGEKWLVL